MLLFNASLKLRHLIWYIRSIAVNKGVKYRFCKATSCNSCRDFKKTFPVFPINS